MFEEIDHAAVERVVLRMSQDGYALAWTWKGYRQDLPDQRCRAVGHQNQTVRKIERLVDVVRDHDDNLAVLLPDVKEDVLQLVARHRVEHGKRFVEEQQPRVDRQGTRQRHALRGAEREFPRQTNRRLWRRSVRCVPRRFELTV